MDIIHQVQAHSGQAEIEDTVRILHERIDSRSTIRRLHRTVVWLGAAASLLLMLLVGSGIARYRETNRWISVTNPAGSPVKDFKLPDGTQVFLNEKSSFSYRENRYSADRTVRLDGEAWFDVHQDVFHPFLVRTADGVAVRVVGTEFNLKTGKQVEAVLERGRIELLDSQGRPIVVMKPGQMARVSPQTGRLLSLDEVRTSQYTKWRNPYTVYESISFEGIVRIIEEQYGVHVQYLQKDFEDVSCRFVVWKNDSLDDFLQILGTIIPVEYTFVNDHILSITKKY